MEQIKLKRMHRTNRFRAVIRITQEMEDALTKLEEDSGWKKSEIADLILQEGLKRVVVSD